MSDQREQQRPLTTTDAGSPAPSDDTSLTVGAGGPVLLQDRYRDPSWFVEAAEIMRTAYVAHKDGTRRTGILLPEI